MDAQGCEYPPLNLIVMETVWLNLIAIMSVVALQF